MDRLRLNILIKKTGPIAGVDDNLEYFCKYHLKNPKFTTACTSDDLKINTVHRRLYVNDMYNDYGSFFKSYLHRIKKVGKSWKDMVKKFHELSRVNGILYNRILECFGTQDVIYSVSKLVKNKIGLRGTEKNYNNYDKYMLLFYYNQFRERYIPLLLNYLIYEYHPRQHHFTYSSVGSKDITSDLDVSIYIEGEYMSKIIGDFYNNIRIFFDIPSDVILDSNLYTSSHLVPVHKEHCNDLLLHKIDNKCYELISCGKENEHNYRQTAWSLVKVHKVEKESGINNEITSMIDKILGKEKEKVNEEYQNIITTDNFSNTHSSKRLELQQEYTNTYIILKNKYEQSAKVIYEECHKYMSKYSANIHKFGDVNDGIHKLIINNKTKIQNFNKIKLNVSLNINEILYSDNSKINITFTSSVKLDATTIATLGQIKAEILGIIQTNIDGYITKIRDIKLNDMCDITTWINYFSSEGYLTYGAFLISVGYGQMKLPLEKLPISYWQKIDCIFENFGDLMHKYIDYKDDYLTMIHKTAKYASRIYEALDMIKKSDNTNIKINDYKNLKYLSREEFDKIREIYGDENKVNYLNLSKNDKMCKFIEHIKHIDELIKIDSKIIGKIKINGASQIELIKDHIVELMINEIINMINNSTRILILEGVKTNTAKYRIYTPEQKNDFMKCVNLYELLNKTIKKYSKVSHKFDTLIKSYTERNIGGETIQTDEYLEMKDKIITGFEKIDKILVKIDVECVKIITSKLYGLTNRSCKEYLNIKFNINVNSLDDNFIRYIKNLKYFDPNDSKSYIINIITDINIHVGQTGGKINLPIKKYKFIQNQLENH